jgi:LAGLIDADG DNA endonuclease family protein
VRRRIAPDEAQIQIILGSLLGEARIAGTPSARRMTITHDARRADYVQWKYERLAQLAEAPPARIGDRIGFRTIAHPIFDGLAAAFAPRGPRRATSSERSRIVRHLLGPLGLAVWMADMGRVELRPELFVPVRALAACA